MLFEEFTYILTNDDIFINNVETCYAAAAGRDAHFDLINN